jgi:hypothetical protein
MVSTSVTSFVEQDKPRAKKQTISTINQRKYDETYIEWGLSCTPNGLQPLRAICGVTLSNHSMKAVFTPETLQVIPQPTKGKSKDFLNAKRQDLSTQQATLKTNINISSKCL